MSPGASLPLMLLIALTAAGAILVRELIATVFILGSYSFFLAVLWAWQGAVDVAFTEAVVGAGLSTIFFVLTFYHAAPEHSTLKPHHVSYQSVAGLVLLGVLLVYGAFALPTIGDPGSPASVHLSPDYLRRSLADTHTPNVVTAILMDYRSLDTLIETAVIFTAGMSAALLLRRTH